MQHIAIEGMDGVGKTTASKLLAKRLGYKFIDKNLRELFDDGDSYDNYIRIRDKVNASPDRLFTAWFYALGNIYLHTAHEKENIHSYGGKPAERLHPPWHHNTIANRMTKYH